MVWSGLVWSILFYSIPFSTKIVSLSYVPKPAPEMAWEYEEYDMLFQTEMPLKMGMRKARQTFSED